MEKNQMLKYEYKDEYVDAILEVEVDSGFLNEVKLMNNVMDAIQYLRTNNGSLVIKGRAVE